MTLSAKPQDPGRFAEGDARLGQRPPRPAPPLSPPPGTRDRGQRQRRLSKRPRSQPGPPAAHLRVSPPPSAPTVHPAGPGGGCSDAAPTGPRAARPGLPAPGTHRVPASHRLPGAAGLQRRKERQKGCLPSPTASQPLSRGSLQFPLWRRSGPAPPPGSHFGSGGPVAITAQQLTRRRSGAGSSGGGGGARQGGSNKGPRQISRELSRDGSTGMQPSVRAM